MLILKTKKESNFTLLGLSLYLPANNAFNEVTLVIINHSLPLNKYQIFLETIAYYTEIIVIQFKNIVSILTLTCEGTNLVGLALRNFSKAYGIDHNRIFCLAIIT